MSYQHQYSLTENQTPLSPSASHYSIQSDLARSIDELSPGRQENGSPKFPKKIGLSENDLNVQLLDKLNSVIENPIYNETDRQRILKYVSLFCGLKCVRE